MKCDGCRNGEARVQRTTIIGLVAGLAIAALAAYLCLEPQFKQFCGESAIYRIGTGLYVCEYNNEAADDFACTGEIEGRYEGLLLRDLSSQECTRVKPHRFIPWIRQ